MDKKLLDIIVCPVCKGKLEYEPDRQRLICRAERIAYPVRDGIPILLDDEATPLGNDSDSNNEPA